MKLVDMQVKAYLDMLKSDAPAPGGGSAAALSSAQGIGLCIMVMELTIGREKYKEFDENLIPLREKMQELFAEILDLIDEDTCAYNRVSEAYKLPKDTDGEKEARSQAIREALKFATEVPYRTCAASVKAIELAGQMKGFNPNAASDIAVGVQSLLLGAKAAWMNVKINLSGLKDEELKQKFSQIKKEVEKAQITADRIYEKIEEEL